MKQFFKYVLATIVGVIVLWFLAFLIFGVVIGSSIKSSMKDDAVKVDANSILKLEFSTGVNDRPSQDEDFLSTFLPVDLEGNYGLRPTIQAIQAASEDDKIRGIYLESDGLAIGLANLTALEQALTEFKDSGKFVVANSRFMTQRNFALASLADEVYMHPEGYFDFRGFYASSTFLKGTLDKLGVEPMVFYAGKFKSATEPFRRKNMSEENKLQTREFLEDFYTNYIEMVSSNRNISADEVRDIANEMKVRSVEDAVEYKLIDGLKYDDEIHSLLKEKIGFDEEDDLEFVSLQDYSDAKEIKPNGKNSGDNRIAVVYAEGTIDMSETTADTNGIGGDEYAKIIRKLRKNDKIKAVVLRVNSPGGSAFASDLIWRELELLKEQKPVVVSMGNLAASGGYYIACNANKIYAEENTITGSIGVFSVLMNVEKFMEDKLGVTADGVGTGKYSDFPNLMKDWTSEEESIIQGQVEDIYGDFIGKVAEGRGMGVEQVHEIAQGRVWSGEDAIEIGLVDEIGSLQDAIDHAQGLAEVDDPRISVYPRVKSEWERIQEIFNIEAKSDKIVAEKLGEYGTVLQQLEQIKTYQEPQMRMPYDLEIE